MDKTVGISDLVDELGFLKAKISELQKREEEIKDSLIRYNSDVVEGLIFRATVSHSERVTLESAKVRGYLTPVEILACQKITPCTTVRVVAKSTSPGKNV